MSWRITEANDSFLTSSSLTREETTEQPGGPAPTPTDKTLTRIISTINHENLDYFQESFNKCQLTIEDILEILEHLTSSRLKYQRN
ncbi:unnamed protein product [Schistosoma guineensis]|uniref:Homeobox domain-containing protein n=2 Tax=Schistosoma TaxID=6181 RepID=A0A183NRT4_9TREM|nr:unnamed protein product [Schistosoma mattheei]CAH8442348.1 unnamed protein product [Schistosoma guineensis]CAH8443850.1 unnamed protein product [Schistosoma haematobium]CAH8444392.1 unnamed protein product [Schistosoma curassoni]CAH8478913.1 unnamed protein product [Schistosoma bovis]